MPEPRSLEEWANWAVAEATKIGAIDVLQSWRLLRIIKDVLHAYAEQENSRLIIEVEQLRVQLAGCLVAVEGSKSEAVHEGVYGWSPAFESVRTLRAERDALLAVAKVSAGLLQARDSDTEPLYRKFEDLRSFLTHPDVRRMMGPDYIGDL